MKNPTHYCLFLFTAEPVEKISLKTQLSMISTDLTAKKSGMISAFFEIVKSGGIQ
jgi:hypothetical protein